MSECYHEQWRAELDNKKIAGLFKSWIPWVHPDQIPDSQHFKLDNFLNGWYLDAGILCSEQQSPGKITIAKPGCTKNPDGTYDLNLIVEFSPQRYFYVGLIVSVTTLIACIWYLIYSWQKQKPTRDKIIMNA